MNPFSKYPGIHINGRFYSQSDLKAIENPAEKQSFLNDILSFASSLLSDSSHMVFRTSGSTGKPKEISFSKEAIHKSAKSTNEYFHLKKGKKAFLSLPLEYVAGKMMVARAIAGEYELVAVEPSLYPIESKSYFHFAPFTPHQFENILDEQLDLLPEDSTILLGGSSVSESLKQKIRQIPNSVYLGFGMTETLTHFALANLKSPSQTFELMPGAEIKINEHSTLSIRRFGINDSWLETTDVVEPVRKGFIWKGRKDNVINSGGVKLHPEEIEHDLAKYINYPFFVYGIEDDALGEKLVLFVEGEHNPNLSDANFSNKFSKPKQIVLLEAFKRTESGKIRRQATVQTWLQT